MTHAGFALLAVLAVLALAWPLLRRREDASEPDPLAICRDQLREVERDRDLGSIDPEAAAAARREIERRMLAEDERHASRLASGRDGDPPRPARARSGHLAMALLLALFVAGGAAVIYGQLGSVDLADGETAAESVEAPARDRARTGIADLERRLARDPGDLEGWLLLTDAYTALERYGEAAGAMAEAVALDPTDPAFLAGYGELMALDRGGTVTPAARHAFERALAQAPGHPLARYYLALALAQAGEAGAALAAWRGLLADTPSDAHWRAALVERIREAEDALGPAPAAPPGEPVGPSASGPTPEDIEAAAALSPEERMAMVRGMVEGLAARLETEPGNLRGWSRLATSYAVLEDWAGARAAYEHALALAPGDPRLLDGYAEAVANGLDPEVPVAAETAARLDALLERRPDHLAALYVTGLAAAQAGDGARAKARWTRLRDFLAPGSPEREWAERLIESLP